MTDDAKGKTRLNLGSGKDFRPEYLNVDSRENGPFPVDLNRDMRDLDFPAESFVEVLAQDVLDHVTFVEAKVLLRKIYGWLKPDGLLHIHTPNLPFLAQILSLEDNHEALTWLYGSDGETSFYSTNFIRWAYSEKSLKKILEAIGFTVFKTVEDCGGAGLTVMAKK